MNLKPSLGDYTILSNQDLLILNYLANYSKGVNEDWACSLRPILIDEIRLAFNLSIKNFNVSYKRLLVWNLIKEVKIKNSRGSNHVALSIMGLIVLWGLTYQEQERLKE